MTQQPRQILVWTDSDGIRKKRRSILRTSQGTLLGGSWVVISGFISPLIWVISIVTLLISTHEPLSRVSALRKGSGSRILGF